MSKVKERDIKIYNPPINVDEMDDYLKDEASNADESVEKEASEPHSENENNSHHSRTEKNPYPNSTNVYKEENSEEEEDNSQSNNKSQNSKHHKQKYSHEDQQLSEMKNEDDSEEKNRILQNLYERFSQFAAKHNIDIGSFWLSKMHSVYYEEFESFMQKCRFEMSNQERQILKEFLTSTSSQIEFSTFAEHVTCWSKKDLYDFVNKNAVDIIEKGEKERNFRVKPFSGRPVSSNLAKTKSRPTTSIQYNNPGNLTEEEKERRKKILQEDIKKKKNKDKEDDAMVKLTIQKIQYEKSYQSLIKMSEANEMCAILEKNTTYRVFHSADGTIKCHKYEGDKYVKSLTMEEFERKYKSLKLKLHKKDNLKVWDILSVNDKKGMQVPNDKEMNARSTKANNKKEKSERQDALQQCLTETMNLTMKLKEQLAILKKKGINQVLGNTTGSKAQYFTTLFKNNKEF